MNSISDIKKELNELKIDDLSDFISKYNSDERTGVKALVKRAKKQITDYNAELDRIKKLSFFENKYNDYKYICGIDEVGRGPLAGPVVAGAVILPKDCDILYINDSKKLTAKKREELYEEITNKAVAWSTALCTPEEIDALNILQATYNAMKMAIHQLNPQPDLLLNDAVKIPDVDIKQVPIIRGDASSISIGAASIVAKVTRDRMMVEYDKIYPGYDFASNKGYGSAKHIDAIKRLGPTPIHRKTFIQNFI
ncbi:MAG: ribonuclease HII [Eubacterium sp.]|nr:ribonuclease HII [Eubacterium sp.]